jgi:dephospho-CoA kinase
MRTIGLTGGIASGKSTAARLLGERGARVIDVDRVAHETYASGTPGFDAVVAAFGAGIVGADGAIDRGALGRSVFGDPAALRRLTDIVWPLTGARMAAIKEEAAAEGVAVLVFEAAVLLEAGWDALTDEVWLVRAPRELLRQRLMARNGLDAAQADARIAAQPPDEDRLARADVVIANDGDLAQLEDRIAAAWQALQPRIN